MKNLQETLRPTWPSTLIIKELDLKEAISFLPGVLIRATIPFDRMGFEGIHSSTARFIRGESH